MHLDGGGLSMIGPMLEYLNHKFPDRRFYKMLDWCAGPGFMGLVAQYEGFCEYLALLDISEEAAACAQQSIADNGLKKVRYYLSDNFEQLDRGEKFDIIIGNPPWTYQASNYVNPLISSDPEWALHRSFYSQVKNYLYPGGIVCLTCYEPYQKEVYLSDAQSTPYDIRPGVPADAFKEMIDHAGLQLLDIARPPGLEKAHMGQGLHLILVQFQE